MSNYDVTTADVTIIGEKIFVISISNLVSSERELEGK